MKVLISAQDPGGANSVIPVAKAFIERGDEVVAQVEGAARDMCTARDIPQGDMHDPDVVVVGTSGGPSIEKQVTEAMHGTAPVIAVLDFWSNYWQRFSNPGAKDFAYLPDIVCVIDDIAKEEMIAEGFPAERLVITGNPHFDHFADGITRTDEDQKRILFISQPIRSDALLPGFATPTTDEYQMLEAIRTALPEGYNLFIRLHPRDERNKYDRYLDSRVHMASEATLEEALSKSGLIIGPATPVLMQATAAGKKVLCYGPSLQGPDELVSNRAGVTTRIDSPEELKRVLAAYAEGTWPFENRPLREVWPTGATERVVEMALSLTTQ